MNTELKYWLAFSKLEGVGSASLLDIFNHFGSMKEAWNSSVLDWQDVKELRNSTITTFIENQKKISPDEIEDNFSKKGINVVTIQDDNYPECLRYIHNPPAILYYKGDFLNKNFENALAVVGSRKCSNTAVENTKFVISGLRSTKAIIVSGGAYGIDTAAHKGALDTNLETIAVLGGGLENLYPNKNVPLFTQILENDGVLLSEYYPETRPDVFRFPQRNRIISGLSKGVLVAEANIKSGALITAKLALEQGKEIMCLPGLLSNPNTQGTHKLLKEGAGLVTSGEDIINYLNLSIKDENSPCPKMVDLSEDEQKVVDAVSKEPINVEKITLDTKININDLMIILTMLELKGVVKQLPGEIYMKV